MASLNGLNPSLERAAMSLGAGRARTFLAVTLPLTAPGIAGGFLLTFAIAISAYATPAILGGPTTEVMATMIRRFMLELLDWSLGSAMGAILLVSAMVLLLLDQRRSAAGSAPRHDAALPLGRSLKLAVACVYLFMLGPILITASVAFNRDNRSYFPPRGFSLQWWSAAFGPQWSQPLLFSLELATLTALISAAAGVPLAFAFQRYEFPRQGTGARDHARAR